MVYYIHNKGKGNNMDRIHNGTKHKVFSRVKIPKSSGKNSTKGYLYFIRIGEPEERLYKIGTANNVKRRMIQHCGYFRKTVYVLWVSPLYSKYTTLRIEDRQKTWWIEHTDWEYLENDRFIIPEGVEDVEIKVIKSYPIKLE